MKKTLKFEAPAVTVSRKKAIICACSHGELIEPSAGDALIAFRNHYKPDKVIHLGDWCDTQAWRKGARGTSDEGHSVADDIRSGLQFLERLRPSLVFNGNHEIRIWESLDSPNAIIAHAATATVQHVTRFITKELRADYVSDYNWSAFRRLGPALVGHGIDFNMNAVRSHAAALGNCFIGHLHVQEVASAYANGGPIGVCVGFLGDKRRFHYADRWKSKMRWQTGWLTVEYSDKDFVWQHHRHTVLEPDFLPA